MGSGLRGQQLSGRHPSLWLPLMQGQPTGPSMSMMLSTCPGTTPPPHPTPRTHQEPGEGEGWEDALNQLCYSPLPPPLRPGPDRRGLDDL